ncbi:MAG: ATP synthase F1 subunit epsilon [Deltaproteobacteria bacterium]|nr:MAG: ATP synthase F1 subunit epsilon [Deltaproteobacteria bacterium]
MALHVDIVTPTKLAWSGEATEVGVPGFLGEFDVLPGHEDYLSLTTGGLITVTDAAGKVHKFVVGRGFAEAGMDRVTVLVDSCLSADEVDKASAQREFDEAEQALGSASFGEADWTAAEEKRELAAAKLRL